MMSSKIIITSTPKQTAQKTKQTISRSARQSEGTMWDVLLGVGHFAVLVLMLLVLLGR